MKIACVAFAIILLGFLVVCASAYDNDDQNTTSRGVYVKQGLEAQEVSPGVTVVTPQGAQMTRINNSLSVMESTDEYASRKFVDVNDRFTKLEKRIDELEKELYFIKKNMYESNRGKVVTPKR